MKKVLSFAKKLLLVFTIFSSTSLLSFHSLIRDYRKFENLINTENKTIYLNNEGCNASLSESTITRSNNPKNWTFIVYMAADNDLRAFAANNIKQMASIGSNQFLNIAVHLDIKLNGNQKITRRYYVEKNKITHLNTEPNTQRMDSGDPKTLVSACEWAIKSFPAKNYALILWNHGTGIIDPKHYKVINPAELFSFNPKSNLLELDRSIEFLDFLQFIDLDQRGICWDNTTGNFLTNEKLDQALNEVCTKTLKGKFDLIGFDACLMSMVEIGHIIKKYSTFMVGSQEVELGTGWNYSYVLQPLTTGAPYDTQQLAQHIVTAYKRSYDNITNDFTQSGIDLRQSDLLEKNLDTVARLLLEALKYQNNKSVMQAVQTSRNRKNCTHFDEPSYIDLHHFYCNLQDRIPHCSIAAPQQRLIQNIVEKIKEGKQIISSLVFANIAGHNLKLARGISIYFPEQRIHPSYPKTTFAQSNAWYHLINVCK